MIISIPYEIPSQNHTNKSHWSARSRAVTLVARYVHIFGWKFCNAKGPRSLHVLSYRRRLCTDSANLIGGAKSNDFNLGAGRGYSVREVIDAVGRIAGKPVPCRSGPRRAGDPPVLIANPAKAMRELGWKANYSDLDTIVTTALAWHRQEGQSMKPKLQKD